MSLARDRLYSQRLAGARLDTPEAAVRWLGAVQAQDYRGAKWALALRTDGADDGAIERAFNAGRIMRIHAMRPTWHFVAPEDLRWLLALTSSRVQRATAHRHRQLELDDALLRAAATLFTGALAGGRSLTRRELADLLEGEGISTRGQRIAHILMHAELSGVLCSGPLRGKQHTYALVDERVAPAPSLAREEALAVLARRYFTSHGPASAHDFAWWSGLTVSDARIGADLAGSDIRRIDVDGKTYWMSSSASPAGSKDPIVHLLPNYDEHVVAYRDHSHTIDPAARSVPGTRSDRPLHAHVVVRNGLIVGNWRRTLGKARAVVEVDLLIALRARERAALEHAAEQYGRFIGLPVVVAGI